MEKKDFGSLSDAFGMKRSVALACLFGVPFILWLFVSDNGFNGFGEKLLLYPLFVAFGFFLFGVINPYYRIEFYAKGIKTNTYLRSYEVEYCDVTFSFERKTTYGGAYNTTGYHLVIYSKQAQKPIAHYRADKNEQLVNTVTYLAKEHNIPVHM